MSDELDVIAQRGASLLIRVDSEHARILDARHRRIFPVQRVETALARGYWTEFSGDLTEVAELLSSAIVVGEDQISLLSSESPAALA